jgi:hypothetical protein
MGVEELLDDNAFDPEKLFNEEEYSTLIIGREGFSKKENDTADLLQSLLAEGITRQESEAVFSRLKETNSQKVMVEAFHAAGRISEKRILVAACWECGLDFSAYFRDFVTLATHEDFQLALEALSVVENTETVPDGNVLTEALEIAGSAKSPNTELISDLIDNIKSRIA